MALTDPSFYQTGLCRIQLPGHDILLCDGGFVDWPGIGTFKAEDPVFGTMESVAAVNDKVGDEAPESQVTLQPPSVSAAADLFRADAQFSPVECWLAEIDPSDGSIVGTPESVGSGFVNTLALHRTTRKVEIGIVSEADRFFWTKEGNVLNPRFHKSVWPGELGLDFATGTQTSVPWGVEGPGRGTVSTGGGGGFGGGGRDFVRMQLK